MTPKVKQVMTYGLSSKAKKKKKVDDAMRKDKEEIVSCDKIENTVVGDGDESDGKFHKQKTRVQVLQ